MVLLLRVIKNMRLRMENIITLPSSLSTQCQYQLQQPNDLFYHNIHIFLQIQHTLLEWHLYSKNTLQTPTVGYCWYTNHHATSGHPIAWRDQREDINKGPRSFRCIQSHNPSPSLCCEQRSDPQIFEKDA